MLHCPWHDVKLHLAVNLPVPTIQAESGREITQQGHNLHNNPMMAALLYAFQ